MLCIASRARDALLNETLFHGLGHTRAEVARWVEDYNAERPHSALGYQTPAAFARKLTTATDRHAALSEGYAQRPVAPPAPNGVPTERTLAPNG